MADDSALSRADGTLGSHNPATAKARIDQLLALLATGGRAEETGGGGAAP